MLFSRLDRGKETNESPVVLVGDKVYVPIGNVLDFRRRCKSFPAPVKGRPKL